MRKLIRRTPDGAFALDLDYFEFHTTAARVVLARSSTVRAAARPYDPIDLGTAEGKRFADIAASVQLVLEEMLVDMARALQRETGLRGPVPGRRSGAERRRQRADPARVRVRALFVPPAPGDAGCALGAALYADRIHFGNPDRDMPDHPFWGPAVEAAELARIAREDGLAVESWATPR